MLNLDTHILVHALSGALTARERPLLAGARWSISAIVIWELAMLERRGRVSLDIDSREFARLIATVHVFPIDLAVCRRLKALDFRSDPADELIAATSLEHNVPLLTRDAVIRRSKVVPLA